MGVGSGDRHTNGAKGDDKKWQQKLKGLPGTAFLTRGRRKIKCNAIVFPSSETTELIGNLIELIEEFIELIVVSSF